MHEDQDLYPYVTAGDRQGYIEHCLAFKKTAAGKVPTRSAASGWFNLHETLSGTNEDLWVHREKDRLWWTTSRDEPLTISLERLPDPKDQREVHVFRKKVQPWSNQNAKGNRLDWLGLHAKARDFLFTERTFQKLSPDNAQYTKALLEGGNLSTWHERAEWQNKATAAGRSPVLIFNSRQKAVSRMAATARDAANASGTQHLETKKIKQVLFPGSQQFEKYIDALIESQNGLCAITGILLQYDGAVDDVERLCSLDRINSDGNYEPGNLQVVCRFVNRWKGASQEEDFRRLIALVRAEGSDGQ